MHIFQPSKTKIVSSKLSGFNNNNLPSLSILYNYANNFSQTFTQISKIVLLS